MTALLDVLPMYGLVLALGFIAALCLGVWDNRSGRRDTRPDVGLSILRSDRDDASEAEVLGLVAALRATDSAALLRQTVAQTRAALARPSWDQPTGELPAVQLLPVWPARAPALPLPMSVSMVTPQPWMRGKRRYVQPTLEEVMAG